MGSFGDKLKREREMRAITLEEIADATKIGTRSLRALEEEHFDQLPGGIFNKGFVRAYAKFLGLDEEQAVADYIAAASSDAGNSTTTQLAALADQVEQHRAAKEAMEGSSGNTFGMLAVIVVVVLLCGLGFGGYKAWKYKQQQDMNAAAANRVKQTPSPVALNAQPAPPAASTDVNTSPADGTAVSNPTTPAGASTPASTPATTTSSVPATTTPAPAKDTASKDATKPATSTTATTTAPEFPIVVTLKAVKPSWVSVTSDGKTVYQQTMGPSDQLLTWHGKEKILLVVGNAAGVEVSFNGKSLGPLGSDGQTRKLTITPQGPQQ